MQTRAFLLILAVIAPGALASTVPAAGAADGVLYEVSEAIDISSNGKGKGFRSSEATLSGALLSGTPLCPSWVTAQLGTDSCWALVRANGAADDHTGMGPVKGTIFVLAEFRNTADAPERKILTAEFDGQLDLSPAFFQKIPRGTITGTYTAKGVKGSIMDGYQAQGRFIGTFRLPFMTGQEPSYLLDNGTVVPVQPSEYSVGQPTPRLEVTFTGSTPNKDKE